MSGRESVIWCITGKKKVNYACAIVYLCCDVCACVSVHIPEPVCMPLGVHACVCVCVGVFWGGSCFSCIFLSTVMHLEDEGVGTYA